MNNKEPEWFISSLRWSFSAIALILLFLGVYSFIYYSTISLDSKISSFFSFISAFGIAATIVVYFWQKRDASKSNKESLKKIAESHFVILEKYSSKIESSVDSLIKMNELISQKINKKNYSQYVITYRIDDIIEFELFELFGYNNLSIDAFMINRIDITPLSIIYANSISIGSKEASAAWFVYEISLLLNSIVDQLIIAIERDNSWENVSSKISKLSLNKFNDKVKENINDFKSYLDSLQ
ncbi:hypothetical protein [Morganella morganii]|uniref:hypothetical protein n=1 Tax=Morganella morganii TaxID=582 RepID=UPI00339CD1BA